MALTALMPAVGLLAYNELAGREQRSLEIHEQAAQASRLVAAEIERTFEGTRSLLIAVSAIPAVMDQNSFDCTSSLGRVSSQLPWVGVILVVDTSSKLVCDSSGTHRGMDFADRSYIAEALQSTDMVVGEYTISKLSDTAILPVAMPLRRDGKTVGVVATAIRLAWLEERVKERGLLPGGAVTIADRHGVILARNPEPERFVGTRIPQAYQYLLSLPRPGTIELTSQDGTVRIVGYQPISPSNPVYISAGLSKELAFKALNRTTWAGLAMLGLGAVSALIAAIFVGNRFILKPIVEITGVIGRWRTGDVDARTRMEGRFGELGMVGMAVDALLDELHARRLAAEEAEQQRDLLTRELNHRVKNTLSIIQGIARQTFKGQHEALSSFSSRLGALATAYDVLFSDRWESATLATLVCNTLVPYDDGERFELQGPDCTVGPKCALALSLIVHELATNAVKYGSLRETTGSVGIAWSVEDDFISFEWQERGGPLITPPQREGFGSKLIRGAFPSDLLPELAIAYLPEGLRFNVRFKNDLQPVASDEIGGSSAP